VLTSTLPSSFPGSLVKEISRHVRAAFSEAAAAQLPLTELVINYPSLKITARELRGGVIIYLAPRITGLPMSQS
jgi:hypothetical protein